MAKLQIFVRHPFGAGCLDQLLGNLGHLARIDIVRADDEEFLLAQFLDDPGDVVGELLVRNGTGIDDVARALEAFVMCLVEQHRAPSLEDRQHGLAASRGMAAEHGGDLVLEDQLRSFLAEGLRIGSSIFDDHLDRTAENTAGRVDFGNGHRDAVCQKLFCNRKPARLRIERTDLDRIGCEGAAAQSRQGERGRSGGCGFQKFTSVEHHLGSPFFDWRTTARPAERRGFHAGNG
jgi:hypothetical protein